MHVTNDHYSRLWDDSTPSMSSALLRRIAIAGRLSLALLAFSLPYEAVLLTAGPLQFTNLEALLLLVLLCTAALVVGQKRWRRPGWLLFPRAWLVLWALLALALLLSTLLAPEHRLNAAKATARLLSGMALALCTPQLLLRADGGLHSLLRWVVAPLLLGGAPAVLAGLWEVWRGMALPWLAPFRPTPTNVGPFIRLTASFDHANQAAMYLEATVPFVLAAVLIAYRRRARIYLPLALLAVVLWLQAVISTYSRTAVVAIIVSAALVAALFVGRHFRAAFQSAAFQSAASKSAASRSIPSRAALPWALLAIALLLLTALNALFDPVVRMRMRTEGDNEWYNLSFEAPANLQIVAGHTVTTTVIVHNEGDLVWVSAPPQNIFLAGRWLLPGEDDSLAYTPRWSLPHRVAPGESATMQVGLRAPLQPGAYQFRWDMIHEGSTWFSYKNGLRTLTAITVTEGPPPPTPVTPEDHVALSSVVEAPPDLAPIPARRVLWRIAAQEFAQRPLTGIGLDNFRLVYGRALDYEQWDETIHTNNWYVEMLVSLGLLGAIPFFAWLALLALSLVRALLSPGATLWHAVLAAALFTFLLHGLLDYFLTANNTGLLFWLFNGLWVAVVTAPRGSV